MVERAFQENERAVNTTSAEFEERFFADAKRTRVEIELLEETRQEVLDLIQKGDLEEEEGWRAVIGAGLGFLKAERALQVSEGTGNLRDEELKRLLNRLSELESIYAVLKFRTFGFMKDNQTLELKMSGLRASLAGLEKTVDRLRAENEALKQEVIELRAKGAALPPDRTNAGEVTEKPVARGWKAWLARRLLSS
jgi:uncharacterized membrane-anchored protein